MHRLSLALGLAFVVAGCGSVSPAPGTAMLAAAPEPECQQSTPGNSIPGFRCTGDCSGDASTIGRGR